MIIWLVFFQYDEYHAIYVARRVPVDSLNCFQTNGLELHPMIGDSWKIQVGREHYLKESHMRGCKVHVDEGLNRFWTSSDTTVIRVEGNGHVKVVGLGSAKVYFDNLAAGGQSAKVSGMSLGPFWVFSDSMKYELINDQTEIRADSLLTPARFRIIDSWADTTVYAVVTPMETECFDRIDHQTPTSSIGWRLRHCNTDTVRVKYTYGAGLREDRVLRIVK